MAKLVPVILSGGSGTRLWPLSTAARPKQFLPLVSAQTMLQETALRVGDRDRFAAPIVVCNKVHRFHVAEQLRRARIAPQTIILEPIARNTAPAIAAAAHWLMDSDPDAIMLVLPSDHVISDVASFHAAAEKAADAASVGHLVTFGLKPTAPETGYGYIQIGSTLDAHDGVYEIAAFVEKPDEATAKAYVAGGDHLWNSGMFVLPVDGYLAELEAYEPNMVRHSREAVAAAAKDADFLRLALMPFAAAPSKSVDYAVMERTEKAAVVPAHIGWSDVGSWASLYDILAKDVRNNAVSGNALSIDTDGCYLRSDGPVIAAVGVRDLVVVATNDAVLIVPRQESQRVRDAVAAVNARDGL